jgi:hypothetical protein
MLDKITVKISFPCSEQDWQKLVTIRSIMYAQEEVRIECSKPQVESLSSVEEEEIFRKLNGSPSSKTPLIDVMAKNGVGSLSISGKVVECVRDNPGIFADDCAKKISEEYHIPIQRVTNTINTLSYSKSQRKLNRRKCDESEPGRLTLLDG